MEDSDKPNNEALVLKQLKSIKVALWMLVTVFVVLPVVGAIGTGVVIGFIALKGGDSHPEAKTEDRWDTGVMTGGASAPMESDTTEVKPSWAAATNSAIAVDNEATGNNTVPVEETTDE